MADHSKPTITSIYSDFVSEMDARFDDLAVGLDPAIVTASNVPTNTIRWSSASNKWQKWNGSVWGDLSSSYDIAVKFTPIGNISSTTVQAAIAELDNEKQPIDAGLTSIAALSTSADKMIYTTAADTYATTTLTSQARTFLSAVDVAAQRSTLGLANHQLIAVSETGIATVDRFRAQTLDAKGSAVWGRLRSDDPTRVLFDAVTADDSALVPFRLAASLHSLDGGRVTINTPDNGTDLLQVGGSGYFSGNLGLGVTPSDWYGTIAAMQFGTSGSIEGRKNNNSFLAFGANYYLNSSANNTYIASAAAAKYVQDAGSHQWFTAPSGTAGQPITFMQAMTLSTDNSLTVSGGGNVGKILINSGVDDAGLYLSDNNRWIRAVAGGALTIGQWGAERARFTNGRLLVGTTTDDGSNMLQVGGSGYFADHLSLASAKSLRLGTSAYSYINGGNSLPLIFGVGGSEKMRLDLSGNLGLGVTPSAWGSLARVIETINGTCFMNYSQLSQAIIGANCYYNGTSWVYKNTAASTNYEQLSGMHRWFIAPSGTAGNAITFTQAMTLNASGRLLLNKTNDDGVNIAQFNGTIAATTPTVGDNSTKVATTAFVKDAAKCRAWVNFNGTGTVSIRASFNVSSVTDTGNGSCTVNFTTAFSDVNYAPCLAYSREVNVQHGVGFIAESNMTTSSCEFQFFNAANSANTTDKSVVGVSFFR